MLADYPWAPRWIKPPLTADQLKPLHPKCAMVQFCDSFSEKEFRQLADFMALYPDVELRIFDSGKNPPSLECLRFFPTLKRFKANLFEIENFESLKYLPEDVEYLGLGRSKKKLSLKILERFQNLRELWIEGQTQDFESVGMLKNLAWLSIRSITLKDLSALLPLENLELLEMKLGGTKDLRLIPEIGRLKYVELWMIRGLDDLSFLPKLSELRYLFLQDLKNVASLPSFKALSNLRRVHLEHMNGLSDLVPISEAPALEQLIVIDMPQLNPGDFEIFTKHATLKGVHIGLGSLKKNEQVKRILPLPGAMQLDPNWARSRRKIYAASGMDILSP